MIYSCTTKSDSVRLFFSAHILLRQNSQITGAINKIVAKGVKALLKQGFKMSKLMYTMQYTSIFLGFWIKVWQIPYPDAYNSYFRHLTALKVLVLIAVIK